jgi:hypothetical protein
MITKAHSTSKQDAFGRKFAFRSLGTPRILSGYYAFHKAPLSVRIAHRSLSSGVRSLGRRPIRQTRSRSPYGSFQHKQQPRAIPRGSTTALCTLFQCSCSRSSIRFTPHNRPFWRECAVGLGLGLGSATNQEEKPHDNELSRMSTQEIEV